MKPKVRRARLGGPAVPSFLGTHGIKSELSAMAPELFVFIRHRGPDAYLNDLFQATTLDQEFGLRN